MESIYHYTDAKTALNEILDGGELRLTPLDSMKDPTEAEQEVQFMHTQLARSSGTFGSDAQLEATGQFIRSSENSRAAYSREAKARYKLACFSTDSRSTPVALNNSYGLGFAGERMWQQYARDHTGICIALNERKVRQRFLAKFEAAVSCKVRYVDGETMRRLRPALSLPESGVLSDQRLRDILKQSVAVRIGHKTDEWQSDSEYRMGCYSEHDGRVYLSIEGCIHDIVVSHACDETVTTRLETLCREKQWGLWRLDWQSGVPCAVPLFSCNSTMETLINRATILS